MLDGSGKPGGAIGVRWCMATASFNGTVIAESDDTVVVEGNHYFPPSSIDWDHFTETERTTGCPWKGTANYFSVTVDGERADNAAWTYREPKEKAEAIRDHVAFYPAVSVEA